jgi:outer membrane protein OmpA-like peptidoglycan-associated protein/tetratricopeptide (TPR) repeat protein
MYRFLLLVALFIFNTTYAQWYKPEKIAKKIGYKYGLALNEAEIKNYDKALTLIEECIKADPRFVDAWLSKGGILSSQKKYKASLDAYEKGIALDTAYAYHFLLPYSIALAGNGQFQDARNAIQRLLEKPYLNDRYQKSAQFRKKCYDFALDYETKKAKQPYLFSPKNLGEAVNSSFSEYFPSLTIDEKQLVFTRRVNHTNEDFFVSRNENKNWLKAVPMPGNLNSDLNEGAQQISQDGSMLVYTGCNRKEGEGSCDLYVSYFSKNQWSEGFNLGNLINTEQWESQPCLSPDKRALYFSARLPQGYGGSDLYVSHLQNNGRWGKPMNMGNAINTAGDESSPFIHADNQTFYFTSNGLPGYGGTDLFLMRKKIDGNWDSPQNLGYPINTIDDEGTLIVAADGKTAYYASDRSDSYGGLDLYTFQLPLHTQPLPTYWVSGKVYDEKTREGLPAMIDLTDLNSGLVVSKVQTQEDGTYLVPLPSTKNYAFNVARKGYLFYSSTFFLEKKENDSVYEKDIPLIPIETGSRIVLNNIFFHTGSAELENSSLIELEKLIQLLRENPAMQIEIDGHTDNVGKAMDNLRLSEQRAQSVVTYLLSKGIEAGRLKSKGFGDTQPISDNSILEGRANNRRTELKVLKKE